MGRSCCFQAIVPNNRGSQRYSCAFPHCKLLRDSVPLSRCRKTCHKRTLTRGWWRGNSPLDAFSSKSESTQQKGEQPQEQETPAPAPAVTVPEEKAEDKPEERRFDFKWLKYWYPVAVEEYLDTSAPNAVQLLGRRIVLYKTARDTWEAVEDRCPHRLAALSEGLVDGGELVCAYHGWRFGEAGQVTKIPTLSAETPIPSATLCAAAYPVQVRDGLVWVWPESGSSAAAESISKSPLVSHIVADEGPWYPAGDWTFAEWDNSFEMWLEQGFDPAHAPHLHAGEFNFKPQDAVPMQMALKGPVCAEGFGVTHGPYMARHGNSQTMRRFHAPTTTTVLAASEDGRQDLTVIHYAPMTPYKVRTFFKMLSSKAPSKRPSLIKVPRGMAHVLFDLGDQDAIIMASQERVMEEGTMGRRDYRLASPADRGVGAVREWLLKSAPIPYRNSAAASPSSREAALNRYDRHTKHCPHCKKAVKRLELGSAVCGALSAVALLAAFASRRLFSVQALVALLLGGASVAAYTFRQRYFSRGFVRWQGSRAYGWLLNALEMALVVAVGLANGIWNVLTLHAFATTSPLGGTLRKLPSHVISEVSSSQLVQRLQSGVGELVDNRQEIMSDLQERAAEWQRNISSNSAELMERLGSTLGSTQQDVLQAVRDKLPSLEQRKEFAEALRVAVSSSVGTVDDALAQLRSRLPPMEKPEDLLELIRSKLKLSGGSSEDAEKVLEEAVQVVELEAAGKVVEGVQQDVAAAQDANKGNHNGMQNEKVGDNGVTDRGML